MADSKLSALTAIDTLAGSDTFYVNDNSTSKQISGTNLAKELFTLQGVTATAAELNLVDGSVANTVVNSKAVIYGSAGQVAATTLAVSGATTLTGALAANGGITVDSTNFVVHGTTGAVTTASTVTATGEIQAGASNDFVLLDPIGRIEICDSGGAPLIDFKNAAVDDYDGRLCYSIANDRFYIVDGYGTSYIYGDHYYSATGTGNYQKFIGGFQVKWGLITTAGTSDVTVTFDDAFGSACYGVQLTNKNASTTIDASKEVEPCVQSIAAGSFVLQGGPDMATYGGDIYWIAYGV